MEGRLDHSPHFSKHIPRGELVELLSKSLLYLEVESHWKGDTLTANCKTSFSLLEPHVCSLDPSANSKTGYQHDNSAEQGGSEPLYKPNGTTIDATTVKRKASTPSTDDGRVDKRVRREADDMDVDSITPVPECGFCGEIFDTY